ncbi:MAG: hypothetical protein WBW16_14050 [Bacteroidota bacterium]
MANLNDEEQKRADKWARNLRDELSQRDSFAYWMFVLIFLGMCYLIGDEYNWVIGGFIFVLLVAVLELSYRLRKKKELEPEGTSAAAEQKKCESAGQRANFADHFVDFVNWLFPEHRK